MLPGFVLFRFFDMVQTSSIRWIARKLEQRSGLTIDDGICGTIA
ncbi:phosphatidylglycerophosphatase A, partial [Plesiomonas shigelloides]|nr:phosphatidylglycerophosphatase A [Plesiomonas shigelloides]